MKGHVANDIATRGSRTARKRADTQRSILENPCTLAYTSTAGKCDFSSPSTSDRCKSPISRRTLQESFIMWKTMESPKGAGQHIRPSLSRRPSIDFAACELCNLASAHRFKATRQDEHVIILQCKPSYPELEPLASILEHSNKEIIDFWDSSLLSPIFFVDTPFHNPLSTP